MNKRKVLVLLFVLVLLILIKAHMTKHTYYEIVQDTPQFVKVAVYGTEEDVIGIAHFIAKKEHITYKTIKFYSWGGKYYIIYEK